MELCGTLEDFSLVVIIDLIRKGHKTGRLHLSLVAFAGGVRDVRLTFVDGEIGSAQCGSMHGLDALREAAVCSEGSFEFAVSEGEGDLNETDRIPIEAALAAMEDAHSEIVSLSASFAATGGVLRHAYPSLETITISPEEFRVLAVLHDDMTIQQVIAASTEPAVDTMRIVRQLIDRGLVTTEGATTPQMS